MYSNLSYVWELALPVSIAHMWWDNQAQILLKKIWSLRPTERTELTVRSVLVNFCSCAAHGFLKQIKILIKLACRQVWINLLLLDQYFWDSLKWYNILTLNRRGVYCIEISWWFLHLPWLATLWHSHVLYIWKDMWRLQFWEGVCLS